MIEQIRAALEVVLTDDAILLATVNHDQDGNPKIYEMEARKDEQPPFIVWSLVGGMGPIGHFHDEHAIENPDVQISAWGRDKNEAWQVASAAEERLFEADWSVELLPYSLMRIVRVNDPIPLRDPETAWIHVPSIYRVSMSR